MMANVGHFQGIGAILGVLICRLFLDKIYVKLKEANNGVGLPEHRLPLSVIGGFAVPPFLALYGLCAELKLPLPMLLVCVVLSRMTIVLAMLPIMSYVVDAGKIYSASAVTGLIVLRCLAGAMIPLASAHMTESLGYGWGFAVLALISLVLALIPPVMFHFGARLRQRCEFTAD